MVAVLVVPDAGGGVVAVGDEAGNHGGWGVMLSETAGARGIHGAFRGRDVMALFDGAVFVQQQPFVGGRHDDSAVFQGDDFLYPGGTCLQVAGRGGVFRLQQDERVVAVRIMVRAARVEGCAVGRPGQADQCGVFSGMSRGQGLADVQRANGAEVYHVFLADGAVGGEGEVLAVGMQGEGAGGACGMDFGGNGAVCLVEAQAVRPPVHTGKGEGKQVVVRSEGAIGDDVAVVVVAKKRGAFAVSHTAQEFAACACQPRAVRRQAEFAHAGRGGARFDFALQGTAVDVMEIEGIRPDEQPAVLRVKKGILDAFAQPGYAPGGGRRHFVLFFAVGKMPDGGGTVAGGHQQGFVGIDGGADVRRGQRFALCHKGEREGEGEYLQFHLSRGSAGGVSGGILWQSSQGIVRCGATRY